LRLIYCARGATAGPGAVWGIAVVCLAARRSRRLLWRAEARMIEANETAVKETDRLS
jgi:hypothetical protein